MMQHTGIRAYRSAQDARIYQIPLLAFPGLWAYVYLVLFDEFRVLIDTGSGYGEANDHLENGLSAAGILDNGRPFAFKDLTHILLTHGHIDHFGGLNHIRANSEALIGIHELDSRVLTHYEERLTIVTRRLEDFLIESGVDGERRGEILSLYRITKGLFQSLPVDFTYESIGMKLGPFEFLHVPGHCAGHVVIRLHDILFSGDHIIAGITPHQAPEHLTLGTGLDHYLHSLDRLETWADKVSLTLSGHHNPIQNLAIRIAEIREHHRGRLNSILALLEEPHTVGEVAQRLFGDVQGYNKLLALEEVGAHVEYLYERGKLRLANFETVENTNGAVPLVYQRV